MERFNGYLEQEEDLMKKSKIAFALVVISQWIFAGDVYNIVVNNQVNFVNGNAIIQQGNQNSASMNGRTSGRVGVIYEDRGTYHLGDENFRSRKWKQLRGQCYFIDFTDYGRGEYYLSLKRFGTESAAVFVNERPVGYLPNQARGRRKRPNYWSYQEWISIPSRNIRQGRNTLAICSSPVPRPEFLGDVDDFQIRNIKLIRN